MFVYHTRKSLEFGIPFVFLQLHGNNDVSEDLDLKNFL